MRSFLHPLGWCNGWQEQVEGQRGRENYLCFRCHCTSDEWGPPPPTSKSRMQRLRCHETVANSSTSSPTGGISHHRSTLRYLCTISLNTGFSTVHYRLESCRGIKKAAASGLPHLSRHCFKDKGAHMMMWDLEPYIYAKQSSCRISSWPLHSTNVRGPTTWDKRRGSRTCFSIEQRSRESIKEYDSFISKEEVIRSLPLKILMNVAFLLSGTALSIYPPSGGGILYQCHTY